MEFGTLNDFENLHKVEIPKKNYWYSLDPEDSRNE